MLGFWYFGLWVKSLGLSGRVKDRVHVRDRIRVRVWVFVAFRFLFLDFLV